MHYLETRRELHCMLVHGTLCINLYMYSYGGNREGSIVAVPSVYTPVSCV